MRTISINQILHISIVSVREIAFIQNQWFSDIIQCTFLHDKNMQNLINRDCPPCFKYQYNIFTALKFSPTLLIVYHCGVAKLALFPIAFPTNIRAVVQTNISY